MLYKIPVTWQMAGICEIEADSLEKAIEKAEDGVLPQNGNYIHDSFAVDVDGIFYFNEEIEVD